MDVLLDKKTGKPIKLKEVLEEIGLTERDLNLDSLNVQVILPNSRLIINIFERLMLVFLKDLIVLIINTIHWASPLCEKFF